MDTPTPLPETAGNHVQQTYRKLDQLLLRLLAGELGLFIIILILGIAGSLLTRFGNFQAGGLILPLSLLPLGLCFLANLVSGIWGMILYIQQGGEGYPGTGHLLNWIYIMCVGWLFLVLSSILLSSGFMSGTD